MVKLRLTTSLFLFIMPVIFVFSAVQVHFNWSEYSTWKNQLSEGLRESNRNRALRLSADPIFAYYFGDLERGADPLYLTSHSSAIQTIFREMIGSESSFQDDHAPVRLALYDQRAATVVRVGDGVDAEVEMIRQFAQSPDGYMERVQGGHQLILFPLGLDRNDDGQLSGNERMGYLLADFAFANERYQQLASAHLQQEVIRAALFTLLLMLMIYLAARFVGRPIDQLMGRLNNNAQNHQWDDLNTQTHIVEINHLSQLLNTLNAELLSKNVDLSETRDLALRLAEAKGQFMASISHELRTPINGIVGFSDLLIQESLSPVQRNYLENIQISAKTLHALIDDVLDFSRIQSGQLELECGDFDLLEVVEEALIIVSHSAGLKGLKLLRHYPAGLPLMINGDRMRVSQILLNLLNNAVKFTESGTICLSVAACAWGEVGPRLAFSIRDTGIGIPEDQLETVLQPFVQSDSSIQRRFGGSGLGLSISKQLIELMHGRLDVSSQVHVGSAFDFTLRFGEAVEAQPASPVLSVSRQLRTMLYTLDQATQETVHDSLTLAGLSVETYEQPLEIIQQLLMLGAGGSEVLVCLGGSRHQLDRMYQMLSRFIEEQPEPGKKIRVVLFTSDLQEPGFLDSVFEKQGRVLSNVVSRRELIQSMTALFDDESPLSDERQQPGEGLTRADDSNDLAGYSVLVVDDNQVNLCLEQVVLNNHGAQTTSAIDGLSAINCAKRSRFDLILMDVQMPGMSGNEATACIRQLEGHAHTLIVALTADITDEGKRACLQAGMNAVVTKPFDAKKLVRLIKSHSLLAQGTADSDY